MVCISETRQKNRYTLYAVWGQGDWDRKEKKKGWRIYLSAIGEKKLH